MAKRVVLELSSSTNFVYSLCEWGRTLLQKVYVPIRYIFFLQISSRQH